MSELQQPSGISMEQSTHSAMQETQNSENGFLCPVLQLFTPHTPLRQTDDEEISQANKRANKRKLMLNYDGGSVYRSDYDAIMVHLIQ